MKIPTLSSVRDYLLSMTISCAFEEKNLFLLLFREKSMSFESQSEVWAIWGQLCMIFFFHPGAMFLILSPLDFYAFESGGYFVNCCKVIIMNVLVRLIIWGQER